MMEETVKIHYSKKMLKGYLMQGGAWFLLALINWVITDNSGIAVGWFMLSGLFFGGYFFQKRHGYLILEEGKIKKTTLFGKPIELEKITRIKKFAGDYILIAEPKKMTINTQIIEPDSLNLLNEVLAAVDLPPQLTPFNHLA